MGTKAKTVKIKNLKKKKALALEIIERLKDAYPNSDCTLDYNEAWKLLVSVRLAAQIGDETLAQECCTFLPELCAQNAFEEVSYSETLKIQRGEKEAVTVYKSQLADHWPMWDVLAQAFQSRAFGEDTDKIYQEYISVSSTYDVIQKAQKKGSRLDQFRLTSLLCRVGEDFQIR